MRVAGALGRAGVERALFQPKFPAPVGHGVQVEHSPGSALESSSFDCTKSWNGSSGCEWAYRSGWFVPSLRPALLSSEHHPRLNRLFIPFSRKRSGSRSSNWLRPHQQAQAELRERHDVSRGRRFSFLPFAGPAFIARDETETRRCNSSPPPLPPSSPQYCTALKPKRTQTL